MVDISSVEIGHKAETLKREGISTCENIKYFFEPKSVAVIGASAIPGKLGYNILHNLVEGGFQGKIYPVNPKLNEISGLKCYKSVLAIPDEVDLAVLIVPAKSFLRF